MANEARDVEIDILARDKTGTGVRSAERNFDKLNDSVSKTSRKIATNAGGFGTKAGAAFGSNMVKAFTRAAAGPAAAVLGGVAIAAAPVIGASIAGAIVGGAGVGGVIGGVVLASRDARVQAAGTQLGQTILGSLERRAGVFVRPVLEGIGQINTSFQKVEGNFGSILAKSATFVRPLVSGVTYAFERITIGIDKLVQAAGPSTLAIREGVSKVGEAVEGMFTDLSDNGVDAAHALTLAFNVVAVTIKTVGTAVNLLTEAYGFLAKIGAFGQEAALQYIAIEASAKAAEKANDDTGNSFDKIKRTASAATVQVKTFQETLEEFRGNTLSLAQAQINAQEAIATATATIKENGEATRNATEAGRENNQALIDLANSFNAVQAATEKVNGTGVQAAKVAEDNRRAFIRAAEAAGYTRQQAESLANQYLGMPRNVNTTAKLSKEDAQKKATELRQHLRDIPKTINVDIIVHARGISAARAAISRAGGATGFDAVSHFYAADTSGGTSRTGGPTPVSVTSNIQVALDGRPFREYTQRAIADDRDRQDWRNGLGRR